MFCKVRFSSMHPYFHTSLLNDNLFGAFCRVHGHETKMVPFLWMHGLDFSYIYLCIWVMTIIYLIFIYVIYARQLVSSNFIFCNYSYSNIISIWNIWNLLNMVVMKWYLLIPELVFMKWIVCVNIWIKMQLVFATQSWNAISFFYFLWESQLLLLDLT